MTSKELIRIRLFNQRLSSTDLETPADVVSYFGAIQAQDYAMAKWAIAMRLKKASYESVANAIRSREIIRTHILRPTWHFVSRNDIRWMMQLSAANIRKAAQYMDKQVGLTGALFNKAWKAVEPHLEEAESLSKEEIISTLKMHKIKMDNLLATQFIIRAEIEMLVCNGIANKATYSLFDKIVPASVEIPSEEAIIKLATTYFKSRGPATIKDFRWWSSLDSAGAKTAIGALGKMMSRTTVNGLDFHYFETDTKPGAKRTSVLLPPYDEYMVGYFDGRDVAFSGSNIDKSLVGNGIFKPLILMDNSVAGVWKRLKKSPFAEILTLNNKAALQKKLIHQMKKFESFNDGH